MRRNYHSHTSRCRHAGEYTDEERILAAIDAGYELFGVSDHTPWPFRDGLVQTTRMETNEFPGYVASIRSLAEKYKNQIELPLGLECEGYYQHFDCLKEFRKSVDYLILGHHFGADDTEQSVYMGGKNITAERIDVYTADVVRAMESGLFCCLAHPDIPFAYYPVWDEHCENLAHTVCKTAKALDIPIEYNLLGLQKIEIGKAPGLGYPYEKFWQIAKACGVTAIIGVDSHSPAQTLRTDRYDAACAYLDALGIKRIDRLF